MDWPCTVAMEKNEEGACVLTRATLQGAGTLCHFPGVFEVEKKNKDTLKGICLGHLWEDSQEWTGGQGGRGAETLVYFDCWYCECGSYSENRAE